MGKSALMLKLAFNIAITAAVQKRRIKIFSVRHDGAHADQAVDLFPGKYPAQIAPASTRFMDLGAMSRAQEVGKALMTDYVRIDEKGDLSINEFRARARQAVIKDKCGQLLMIDYLQRMKGSSKRAQGHRELEINEIAQGISATAKELNVPIVVLAQLNRNPEERNDGKPELGDLRESGSIEQEARFVGLIGGRNTETPRTTRNAPR